MRIWRRCGNLLVLFSLFLLAGPLVRPASQRDGGNPYATIMTHAGSLLEAAAARQPLTFIPPGLSIAGLPVGGLSLEEAQSALQDYRLAPLRQPLSVRLGEQTLALDPRRLGVRMDVGTAMAQAAEYARDWPLHRWDVYLSGDGLSVKERLYQDLPAPVALDEVALRGLVESLALVYDRPALPFRSIVLEDATLISARGAPSPTWSLEAPVTAFLPPSNGRRLDVEGALSLLAPVLAAWVRGPVTLPVEEVYPLPADVALLADVLRSEVAEMPGVVGVYVRDLEGRLEIGVHDEVIFSGASVIKIAILLQAYRVLDEAPRGQVDRDMWAMMVHSDNEAANRLLAFGGNGDGVRGSQEMSAMLGRLGLHDSFLCHPYSGGRNWTGCPPAARPQDADLPGEGEPVTDPDEVLQTTPRDMGLLLSYIHACGEGTGPLLETFPGEITSQECQAMLELMVQNADQRRIVAGLPPGIESAHKSGWIQDMKADAGIVFSPGGTYVLSVFVWEEGGLSDEEGDPRIARLSWIIYSFFNPL